jgi:4'-phosphopantetheinyl transferase
VADGINMNVELVIIAIPPTEQPRSAEQVSMQRAYARMALRDCARRSGAPLEGWLKDDRDVPMPNEGYYWSISHKQRYAVAVIAKELVGIDVELIAPRTRELHDALASGDEWERLGDRSWSSFFRLWTAKEAVLKANGLGIGSFDRCRLTEVLDDRHLVLAMPVRTWHVEQFEHDGHLFAVTAPTAPLSWHVLQRGEVGQAELQAAFTGTSL